MNCRYNSWWRWYWNWRNRYGTSYAGACRGCCHSAESDERSPAEILLPHAFSSPLLFPTCVSLVGLDSGECRDLHAEPPPPNRPVQNAPPRKALSETGKKRKSA